MLTAAQKHRLIKEFNDERTQKYSIILVMTLCL